MEPILTLFLGILLAALVVVVLWVVTIIDSIRDKNWIWLLIVLLFPLIGMILYWLFGNKK